MLSCQKASELFEKKQMFPLSRKEKIQLYLHTSVCNACRDYQKESLKLDHFIKKELTHSHHEKLSDEFKSQLINNLKK